MEGNVNQEKLIFDGEEYDNHLTRLIQQSKENILITCYILENESFGKKILQLLIDKAKQGVNVCLVVDGFGSWKWIDEVLPKINQQNFEVRLFHPITWKVMGWNIKRVFSRFNRRNHQKLFIFDGKIGIIGSRNINDEAITWRETSIEIVGPSVETLKSLFYIIWQRSHDRFFKRYFPMIKRETLMKVFDSRHIFSNHTYSLRKQIQQVTLRRILEAKREIYITTPYFFPTNKIMKVLVKRALSGVKVSVLLPQKSDVLISKWVSQYHYQRMLKAKVNIYEFRPQILHAKSMVVDDWALIGSSNFNRRSVFRDLELDYSVDDKKTVQALIEQFGNDSINSFKIQEIPQMGLPKKLLVMFLTKFFSSWL